MPTTLLMSVAQVPQVPVAQCSVKAVGGDLILVVWLFKTQASLLALYFTKTQGRHREGEHQTSDFYSGIPETQKQQENNEK